MYENPESKFENARGTKLTPLDIRQKRFEVTFRGYERRAVEGFLEFVATEVEELVRGSMRVREDNERLQVAIEGHVEREKALQETLVTAQRISEEIQSQAKKQAEVVIAQAELQADKIIAAAQNRVGTLVTEINEMKRVKARLEAELESVIDGYKKLIDMYKTPSHAETAFLVPKRAASGENT